MKRTILTAPRVEPLNRQTIDVPDITQIDSFAHPGHIGVGAKLSSELVPMCGYLMLTHFRGPYWFCHGIDHLLLDRTIDRCGGLNVYLRRWQGSWVERAWFRQKSCWLPLLQWTDEHARHSTIYLNRSSLWFYCRPWLETKLAPPQIEAQLRALVERVNQLT